MSIPFNIPPATGREPEYLAQAIANRKLCGDGPFTQKCHQWLEQWTGAPKALLHQRVGAGGAAVRREGGG